MTAAVMLGLEIQKVYEVELSLSLALDSLVHTSVTGKQLLTGEVATSPVRWQLRFHR
jgi:hypothetical protein